MTHPKAKAERQPSVAIIGAGVGGIGMALELLRSGFDNVTILERSHEIGGVWRENTYPGAGCDVPSPYYSFSFEPEPGWTRRYSGQQEIEAYLHKLVHKYDLLRFIRFDTEVTSAQFDEERGAWQIETGTGDSLEAEVLVPAAGQLSRPTLPDLPGIGRFDGPSFHSARWDHGCELAGKRIAVIGTGASAIQFVPQIQPLAGQLMLFQRSAPYVLPKPDKVYPRWQRWLFEHVPVTQRLERGLFWCIGEVGTLALAGHTRLASLFRAIALWHLRREVPDPRLRAKLTPDYEIGCKRVLFANDFYPAVRQPNVHVETERIAEITPDGVRTTDGVEHPVDVIIYGTGFATNDFLAPMKIRGTGGADIDAVWSHGARAYLGMAVPGFPNMFLMYGPNTNLGSGSVIYMLERQARYIRQVVEQLAAASDPSNIEVTEHAAERFDEEVQDRLAESAWATCSSWYRDDSGRIAANWPGLVSEYDRRTRTLDLRDFRVTPAREEATPH